MKINDWYIILVNCRCIKMKIEVKTSAETGRTEANILTTVNFIEIPQCVSLLGLRYDAGLSQVHEACLL